MYHTKLLISLINLKTIILLALTYIIVKCIISHYSRNPRWVKFSNELPGPPAYPIIGTTVSLLIGARAGLGPMLANYMSTYGPTFRLWFGQELAVVVSDVNDAETILTSSNCMEKNSTTKAIQSLSGINISTATPAAAWRRRRKEYQPFFIKNNLLGRIPEINELNDKFIEKMKKEVDGPEFNLEDYMNDLSFDTILSISKLVYFIATKQNTNRPVK